VELRETNTTPPPPNVPRPAPKAGKVQPAMKSVSITSPTDETTIPMGPGNFSVSASVNGGLAYGQKLQLKLDGQPQGEPQTGTSWSLTNIIRGEHKLVVTIVDDEGNTVASSPPVTVYVLRPSVLYK
jgi:hypothetical protein